MELLQIFVSFLKTTASAPSLYYIALIHVTFENDLIAPSKNTLYLGGSGFLGIPIMSVKLK